MSDEIDAVIESGPPAARPVLRAARRLIEDEARRAAPDRVLEASLKWGQPSFALSPKRGTAIRLGLSGDRPALLVHCGTTLIEDWRHRAGSGEGLVGRRAFLLDPADIEAARPFVRSAFDYRVRRPAEA